MKSPRSKVKENLRYDYGLPLVVTQQLLNYLEKKKYEHDLQLEEEIIVLAYQPQRVLPVFIGREADSLEKAVQVSESVAGDAHIVWQLLQGSKRADAFFREIAKRVNGIYMGVNRMKLFGFVGGIGIREEPFHPWLYTANLTDEDLGEGLDTNEAHIAYLVKGLKERYEMDKEKPMPKVQD